MSHEWKEGDRARIKFCGKTIEFTVDSVGRDILIDRKGWSRPKMDCEYVPPKPSEHEWKVGDRAELAVPIRNPKHFVPSGYRFNVVEVCRGYISDGIYWHKISHCKLPSECTPEIDAKIEAACDALRAEFAAKLAEIAKPEPLSDEYLQSVLKQVREFDDVDWRIDTKPEPASEPVDWAVGDIAMIAFDGYCFEVFGVEGPNLFTKTKVRFRKRSCVQLYSTKCDTLSETIEHIREAIKCK